MCNFIVYVQSFRISMSMYPSRRDVVFYATAPLLYNQFGIQPNKPIAIIGANGGTGRECARLLAEQGQTVKAISRKYLRLEDRGLDKYIESVELDIKDRDNKGVLDRHIRDSSAVFFLANAKHNQRYVKSDMEEFQNFEDIDIIAFKNIVDSCIKHQIPRLIFISAACKSCLLDETSSTDKISGIDCDNCRSKQIAENIVRRAYARPDADGLAYTIIRIGFLMNGENRGASEIEVNQDYTKSGMISRTDLANLCIASTHNEKTKRTTFEAYYRDTTQPYDAKESLNKCMGLGKTLEECFFGEEYKDKKPQNLDELRKKKIKGSLFTTGAEHSGDTWSELFSELKTDISTN